MMTGQRTSIPEFGCQQDGVDYVDRPGVYALIKNCEMNIAVIEVGDRYFLPGGGIEKNESDVDALLREILEETGHEARVLSKIGESIEYIQSEVNKTHYRIHSKFYQVQLVDRQT